MALTSRPIHERFPKVLAERSGWIRDTDVIQGMDLKGRTNVDGLAFQLNKSIIAGDILPVEERWVKSTNGKFRRRLSPKLRLLKSTPILVWSTRDFSRNISKQKYFFSTVRHQGRKKKNMCNVARNSNALVATSVCGQGAGDEPCAALQHFWPRIILETFVRRCVIPFRVLRKSQIWRQPRWRHLAY